MKYRTFTRLLSPLIFAAVAAGGNAQEVDPYALYEAAKAGEITLDAPTAGDEDVSVTQEDLKVTEEDLPAEIVIKPQPKAELEPEPEAVAETVSMPVIKPEAPEPEDIADTPVETAVKPKTDEIAEPEPEAEPAAQQAALPALDNFQDNAVDAAVLTRGDIAPYFLSASEYLELRGDAPTMQTVLTYSVTQSKTGDEGKDSLAEIDLIIGKDYAARRAAGLLKIYDFKYNRLLTITAPAGENAAPSLQNTPLFARAHRNMTSIAKTTGNGKIDRIDIAPGVSLDAFWIESAMSWAMTDRAGDIVLNSKPSEAQMTYKDAPVFSVTLSNDSYADPDQSDVMLAFAHWNLPIHPAGLKQLYGAAPVETMTIASKSPNAPDGETQVWTLTSQTTSDAVFPLPKNAINSSQSSKNPIAFVMNKAARNTALGGRPDYDALAEAVLTAYDADDYEAAWLAAKRYEAGSRPCKKNNIRKACKALRDIEDMRKKPESLETLLTAFENSEDKAKYVQALSALRPWLEAEDTPALVMRTAGVMRAKIDTATAKAAGVDDIAPGALIRGALAKDPYNPQAYLAMAQFYAASGDYEMAWNVFDALRASISQDPKDKFTVDKVEAGLIDRGPGYFMPAVMAER